MVTGCDNSVIPDDGSVTAIGDFAFAQCQKIEEITIPQGVTEIGDTAFAGCHSLADVTIPNGVTVIEPNTFAACPSLTEITIPQNITTIEYNAFAVCGFTEITIPKSVTSIGESAFRGCSDLSVLTVEAGNPVYHSAGNCVIETASKTLAVGCRASVIPDDGSVTAIGESAFGQIETLTSITVPDCVTEIGKTAFSKSSNLASITLGKGLTNVGNSAFYGCDSLRDVYFTGTESEWDAVEKEYGNDPLLEAELHCLNDGKPPVVPEKPDDPDEPDGGKTGFLQRFLDFFRRIIDFFTNLFKRK